MCPLYTWTLSADACTISLSTIIFTQFLVSHALRFLLAESEFLVSYCYDFQENWLASYMSF
jgi:hypothetical protein